MLKLAQYTRHGMTEPLLNITIFKKVEDGKVIAEIKIMVFKNKAIAVYENDKLDGGEVLSEFSPNVQEIVKFINNYYDDQIDDLTVFGEKQMVDDFLNEFFKEEESQ
ncbi:MAG: hypothetical protein OWQ54_01455 [Sulfolobaceae archaeon]|nr:hypothetical protein [Sulfolobaceae archaeon]